MNKTKAKPSTGEGWAVHVYDSDRFGTFTRDIPRAGSNTSRLRLSTLLVKL